MPLTGSFNNSAYGIITTNIFIIFMVITIMIITIIFFIVIIGIIIMYFSLVVSCFNTVTIFELLLPLFHRKFLYIILVFSFELKC